MLIYDFFISYYEPKIKMSASMVGIMDLMSIFDYD